MQSKQKNFAQVYFLSPILLFWLFLINKVDGKIVGVNHPCAQPAERFLS